MGFKFPILIAGFCLVTGAVNAEELNAYSIESQTVYNCRARTAVVLIDKDGKDRLIRHADTYEDMVSYDIY